MLDVSGLRIVVLNCPYDTWDEPRTREMFEKVVSLKLRGYRREYDYGVLPVDTSDFVGFHQMICREKGGTLEPLLAYKTITLDRCRTHGIAFPGLNLARMADGPEHARVVQSIMDRCEAEGVGLSYDSSWTIDPEIREDKEATRLLREIFTALYVLFHDEYGIRENIGGGTLRFKTEKYFGFWGFESLSESGAELPPIRVTPLLGEKVTIMHLKAFTPESRAIADRYRFFWRRRLTIEKPEEFLALTRSRKIAA